MEAERSADDCSTLVVELTAWKAAAGETYWQVLRFRFKRNKIVVLVPVMLGKC